MKNVDIKGIIVPIITPMKEDESINTDVLKEQVDRMIDAGIHAIFCFGTNGEGYILNGKEKELVLSTVVKQVNGRVPVYAGSGCISTKETIEQSKMAEACGADVLSIITPSFAAASQDEIRRHYETVAKEVPDMPIVLYNIPARTGNKIDPATVEKLAQVDNIVGAKDSSGDFKTILGYIDAGKTKKNGTFSVLSGNDQLILWTLKAGGTGGISGCANAYPHNMAMIYDEYVKGNWDEGIGKKLFPKDQFYYDQLGEKRMEALLSWPREYECHISGRKMRLFHGRPTMPEPYYVHEDSEFLEPYFLPDYSVVGYADVHRQGLRLLGFKGILFNTGSVGNGLGIPMAQYAILRGEPDSRELVSFDVNMVTVPYDREQAIRDTREAGERGLVNADLFEKEIITGKYARANGRSL